MSRPWRRRRTEPSVGKPVGSCAYNLFIVSQSSPPPLTEQLEGRRQPRFCSPVASEILMFTFVVVLLCSFSTKAKKMGRWGGDKSEAVMFMPRGMHCLALPFSSSLGNSAVCQLVSASVSAFAMAALWPFCWRAGVDECVRFNKAATSL